MTDIRKWYGNGGRFVSWRMVYAPDDLDTGPRQCQHAQRCPGLSHLPLPKGGYCITAVCTVRPAPCATKARQPRREPAAVVARRGHIRLHLTWSMDDPPQRTLCYVNETDTRELRRRARPLHDDGRGGRHGRRGDPDLPPDQAMRTAWRYVTDHKPAPQGRE